MWNNGFPTSHSRANTPSATDSLLCPGVSHRLAALPACVLWKEPLLGCLRIQAGLLGATLPFCKRLRARYHLPKNSKSWRGFTHPGSYPPDLPLDHFAWQLHRLLLKAISLAAHLGHARNLPHSNRLSKQQRPLYSLTGVYSS